MSELKIRSMKKDELKQTLELGISVFGEGCRQEGESIFNDAFSENLNKPYIVIAEYNNEIIGSVQVMCLYSLGNLNTYGISWLFIKPEHRGKGYSLQLMQSIEHYIANDLLQGRVGHIFLSSTLGLLYYEKQGYGQIFIRHDSVPIMAKMINKEA